MISRQSRTRVPRTVSHFTCLPSNNALIVTIDGNLVFHFPSSNFHASVQVNSQRGVEPHSLETNIGFESINLTLDLVQELISRLRQRELTKSPPTPPSPSIPTSPSLFSPVSPSINFVVGRLIRIQIFCSHPSLAIASRIRCKEGSKENIPRCKRNFLSSRPISSSYGLVRPCCPRSSS